MSETQKHTRKVFLVAEVTVDPAEYDHDVDLDTLVQLKLDAFREAVQPSREYGIHLSRVQVRDIRAIAADAERRMDHELVPSTDVS